MGDFSVQVPLDLEGDMRPVEAVVDTGASDSMFPASLLEELHVEPEGQFRCFYANGASEFRNYGEAAIRLDGRTKICPVIFGPDNQFLLGATTHEFSNWQWTRWDSS